MIESLQSSWKAQALEILAGGKKYADRPSLVLLAWKIAQQNRRNQ